MLTIEDFKATYETYTDDELYSVQQNVDNYSAEAAKALAIVIEQKGGLETLIKRIGEKAIIETEKVRIGNEAIKLGLGGVNASFIKNTTNSTILSKDEVNEIIETNAAKASAFVEDKKVNSETVVKSLIGCGLASLVGGVFASIQVIYFGATSIILVIGTALICYGTVKLVTKKSFNNSVVLISSFVAFIISYSLAYFASLLFGYQG